MDKASLLTGHVTRIKGGEKFNTHRCRQEVEGGIPSLAGFRLAN